MNGHNRRSRVATSDEIVTRLVKLAHQASRSDMTAREQAGLHRLERAALAKGAQPRVSLRFAWLLFPVVFVVAAVGLYMRRERAITFEVVSGKVSDGGYISAGMEAATVRFSDHSDFDLEPGTRLRISDLEVRGARVMLEGGLVHVSIHAQPRAKWTLGAGPYIVLVTGTEFDLAWRVDEQTLDLRLRRGSVVVGGPLAEAGLRVGPGQHLIADVSAGSLSLVDELIPGPTSNEAPSWDSAGISSSVATPPASALPPPLPGHLASVPAARSAGGSAQVREETWAARVARGDFEGIIAEADRKGIEKVLAESSAVDLCALADAARYARHQDVARRALLAQRARYPGSVQARDAPFFLGGLAEGQKDDRVSLEWYDVYLRESAKGAYASQALGRKMMLVQRLQGADSARTIAANYLVRFPDGPYTPSARKLLQLQ